MRVFTHDGVFHADEIFAAAVLIAATDTLDGPIKRTRTDWDALRPGDVVIDVTPRTTVPAGVIVADHHQRSAKDDPEWQRTDGGPRLASAGWAWRRWGLDAIAVFDCPADRAGAAWANIDRSIFWGIDAADNGELPPTAVPVYGMSQAISAFNADDIASEQQGVQFNSAVTFACAVLARALHAESRRQQEYARIAAAIAAQADDPVLVLDKGGAWQNVLLDDWDATAHIQVVIYPDATAAGVWRIQSAPGSKTDPFAMRCGAPRAMRGKRADAGLTLGCCDVEFIHPAGFIGGVRAASAEAAYDAAREWIALSD